LARAGDIEDRLVGPFVAIAVERANRPVRLQIGFQIGKVHVMVAMRQQRIRERGKKSPARPG
jgi:hypothetical protein